MLSMSAWARALLCGRTKAGATLTLKPQPLVCVELLGYSMSGPGSVDAVCVQHSIKKEFPLVSGMSSQTGESFLLVF